MAVVVKFSPLFNDQTLTAANVLASGYQLFTYAATSSTKQKTYTDNPGTVEQSNPIILNASGQPTLGPIWLAAGQAYKFVLALPGDTDPPTSPVKTFDNISGINDSSETTDQWVASGLTPTYINATTFTLVGDQTTDFHVGRRLQFTVAAGTVYGTIATSVYATLTTVTVSLDSGSLDSGLSAINLSILRADHSALPKTAYNVTTLNATGNTVLGDASTDTLNVGNGGIIKDASGNTGIGTTPRVKLDVGGEAAAAVHLRVVPTAGSVAGIGAFLRNDGAGTYLMLTASGDAYGTFNALRPLVVNNTTGKATLDGTATSLSTATGSAPSYSIRAWVDCTSAGVINASGNVSSVTRNAAGDYTVNFTAALPHANYAPMGMVNDGGDRMMTGGSKGGVITKTTTAYRFNIQNTGALNFDQAFSMSFVC